MSTEKAFPAGRSARAKGLGRAASGGPGTQERPGMLQRDPTRPLWRSLGEAVKGLPRTGVRTGQASEQSPL